MSLADKIFQEFFSSPDMNVARCCSDLAVKHHLSLGEVKCQILSGYARFKRAQQLLSRISNHPCCAACVSECLLENQAGFLRLTDDQRGWLVHELQRGLSLDDELHALRTTVAKTLTPLGYTGDSHRSETQYSESESPRLLPWLSLHPALIESFLRIPCESCQANTGVDQ